MNAKQRFRMLEMRLVMVVMLHARTSGSPGSQSPGHELWEYGLHLFWALEFRLIGAF